MVPSVLSTSHIMYPTVHFLPPEILIDIFNLLSFSDLSNIILVCRRWKEAGSEPSLWRSFPVRLRSESLESVRKVLSSWRFSQLEKVRISDKFWNKLSRETLTDYISEIIKLKSVKSIQISLERDVLETPQASTLQTERLIGTLPADIDVFSSEAEILQIR